MFSQLRAPLGRLLVPVGRRLAKTGLSPDHITVVGTIGVSAGALAFYTRGVFFIGTMVILAFVFADVLDGTLARARGRSGPWGAFLDSTMDRIGDGAVFGSLAIWYAGGGDSLPLVCAAVACLVGAQVTSYIKARAQSLGLACEAGWAERTERLVIILSFAGLSGLGVPYVLPGALWFLTAATAVTVGQRLWAVRVSAAGLSVVPGAATEPPVQDEEPPAQEPPAQEPPAQGPSAVERTRNGPAPAQPAGRAG